MSASRRAETARREWTAFDWAVVRLVPRVHQEEFVNVGVLLHARTVETLLARIEPDWARVHALAADFDRVEGERQLEALRRVAAGGTEAGPIGLLPSSERFHWLTAPRSAVIQTSAVRAGRARDLGEALDRLFEEQCRSSASATGR
jgi:Protein of unknown function (DUF3037)